MYLLLLSLSLLLPHRVTRYTSGAAEGLAVRSTFSFGNRNCLDESPVGMD